MSVDGESEPSTWVTNEVPPFVFTRPVRVDGDTSTNRRTQPQIPVYDFEKYKHMLPAVDRPPKVYCWVAGLRPVGLPGTKVRSVMVGGALGTAASDRCASRILPDQTHNKTNALYNIGRMQHPLRISRL